MSFLRRLSLAAAALFSLASPSRADVPALALALDTPSLSWNTGGAVSWTSQTAVATDGVDAARATGLAAEEASTWLETTVNAPGFLSWKWRLQLKQDSYSDLEVFVGDDPAPRAILLATDEWVAENMVVDGAGPVKVRWRLRNVVHVDQSPGDAAFLDTVAYAPFGPPVLQPHADLGQRSFTARWTPVAEAIDYTVEVSASTDFTSPILSESTDSSATSLLVEGLEPGVTYHYRLVCSGPESISAVSAPRTVTTLAITRPANDAFASAAALSGIAGSIAASTTDATTETAESPFHQASVWFKWTAPGNGLWRFRTGPSESALPSLYVFTGSALASLDLIWTGENDDTGAASVEFRAISGVTYYLALDTPADAPLATTLAWERLAVYAPPANDAFASAAALSGITGSIAANTTDATTEANEPSFHQASAWFKWTAPGDGLWRFRTGPADSTASLNVFSGSALASLELIGSGGLDDTGATAVDFETTSGVTYYIALDTPADAPLATTLTWERLAVYAPPANDAFASPTILAGASGRVAASNLRATAEAGETASALRSIWFTWKAPASGMWNINTDGSDIPATISVWSGSSLNGLVLLASDSASAPGASGVSIPVTKDSTYRVSLDSPSGEQGAVSLAWSLDVPSVAQTITGPVLPDVAIDAAPFILDAAASSGLPVTYGLISGPAGIDGDEVTLTGVPGLVRIRASQAGDAVYLPAETIFEFTVQAPPINDKAASALPLPQNTSTVEFDLRFATAESAEAFPARRSVWFRWTAPGTGVWTLDAATSPTPVTIGVYTGAINDLEPVASDARPDVRPRLEIPVTTGSVYLILVDTLTEPAGTARFTWSFAAPALAQTIDFPAPPDVGVSAEPFALDASASSGLPVRFSVVSGPATLQDNVLVLSGQPGKVTVRASQPGDFTYLPAPDVTVSFTVRPPPSNDNASAAIRLVGASGSVTGSNIDATAQPIDPQPANRSVWWRWTATGLGQLTVDTVGGAQPTALSLLRGASAANLELIASDSPADGHGRLTIPVAAGEEIWAVLDTLATEGAALKLTWVLAPPSVQQTIVFDQDLPALVVGDEPPVLSPSASSGLPVVVAVVSGPARTVNGELVLTGQPGTVTLRATQPGDAVYLPAAPVTRTFVVAALPPVKITLSDLRQTYDGTPRPVTASVEPAPRLRDLVVTYNGSLVPPTNAGTYSVVASADDARVAGKLVIVKRPLQVVADDQRKLAGEPNPPLTLSYSGFAPGDDVAALSRRPAATTTARIASPAGSYPIKVSGGAAPNYVLSYSPGRLKVDTFAGRYETLLFDAADAPAGKLEFTVAATGKAFTGRILLARESVARPVKGALSLDSSVDLAAATVSVPGLDGPYSLVLDLVWEGDFTARLSRGEFALTAPAGRRVFVPPAGQKPSWSGAHTVILAPASSSAEEGPAGSGHATAAIDAKGNMKLAGRLGDATPFTATLAPDQDGGYRLFAQPYAGLRNSFVAGELPFFAHPDTARFPGRRHIPAAAAVSLTWTKASAPAAKAYRAGFGPLSIPLTLDPWVRPAVARPLSLLFSPENLDLGERGPALPVSGVLSPSGAFTITAPVTTPANLARFSLKFTPGTGAFTGGFVLSDLVSSTPVKRQQRTVTFKGVLRTPPDSSPTSGAILGAGQFLLAPLPVTPGAPSVSGEILLATP